MCSSHDLPKKHLERSYHLFILGLLASISNRYVIKSNLESGYGRYDILMHPKNPLDFGVLLEFKRAEKMSDLSSLAKQALTQIQDKKYISLLRDFGYTGKVFCYGVSVYKKHLIAKMEVVS